MRTCLWCQHTSRRIGMWTEGCRDSTGLVAVVVLTLRCITNPVVAVRSAQRNSDSPSALGAKGSE
eukprot:scaffold28398_cov28-Tisochrysis_lutea.AAC.1